MQIRSIFFLACFAAVPLLAEVVVPADSPPVQKRAAAELEKYIEKILGKDKTYPRLLLGNTLAAQAGIELKDLGDEGFVICRKNDAVYISSGTAGGRGILYGVYEFLERQGCRFWTEDEEDIPHRDSLWLPGDKEIKQLPAFPLFRWIISGTCHQKWIMTGKLKLNGGSFGFVPKPEDGLAFYLAPHNSHTHFKFMPAKVYGKTHPDYFALQKNGKRLAHDSKGQLCLTNPEMIREYIANVRKYLKEKYREGMILVIVQSDNYAHCQCPRCLEMDRKFGTPSGTFMWFINQIARDLAADYPKLRLKMSAYQYTRTPPKGIRPEKNVVLSLANIECDFSRKIDDPESPENRLFLLEEERWSKIAHTMFVNTYGTSFDAYMFPFPNFDAIGNRYRIAKMHNARGASMLTAHANAFAEFGHLRDYLTAKLLWDPDQDSWKIAEEFCTGYYGKKAGTVLLDYLKFYHRYFAEKKVKFRFALYDRTYYNACLAPEVLRFSREFYDKALAAAESPVFLHRVQEAALSIRCMELMAHLGWIPGSRKWREKFESFVEDAKKAKCLALGEEKKNLLVNWAKRISSVKIPADIGKVRTDSEAETVVLTPSLHGKGKWTSEETDSEASCGKAVKLHTDHIQWAVQVKLLPLARYGRGGSWNIYARVRAETGKDLPPDARLFQTGCWNRKQLPARTVRKQQLPDNGYAYIQLAAKIMPVESAYIWFAPFNNPADVKAVYIDSILAIRNDSK
ncbi:MAG: DUF4838 domain-containing protein [Lentisphaerae bacterium]|nr:DUF4838 domain-containing protein [Lentisphaerota bacterium]